MVKILSQLVNVNVKIILWKHSIQFLSKTFFTNPLFHGTDVWSEIVPALHGTACPRFPGSASYSPRPTADGLSTKETDFKGQWVNIGTAIPMRCHPFGCIHISCDLSHLAELFLILRHLLQHLRQIPHGGLKETQDFLRKDSKAEVRRCLKRRHRSSEPNYSRYAKTVQ